MLMKSEQTQQGMYELPEWILLLLEKHYSSEELCQLAAALSQQTSVDFRINTLKADVKSVVKALSSEGADPTTTKYSPYAIRLPKPINLLKSKLYISGKIEVQNEASQLAGMLLNPKRGDIVVDFCAGSGGKTLLLGMLMRNTGVIYAFDTNSRRLGNLVPRLSRSGLTNVHSQLIANEHDTKLNRLHGKIDRIFVDAPCSGLGTLRKNQQLKVQHNTQTVTELSINQLSILTSASKLLKIGGHLVYATCSILYEENQDVVNKFLADNPNFTLVPASEILKMPELKRDDGCLVLLPHIHQTDGFFAALLKRNS